LIDTEEGHLLIENFVNIFFCNTFIGIVAQSSRLPLTSPVALLLIRKALQEETDDIAKSSRDETWLTGKGAASRSQLVLKMLL
jgi:hypothetical protein